MAGYIGSKASVVSSGAERKKTFAITTTTTVLTGLSYTPTFVHLFHNGVRLVDGTDYTATNGTSITLTSAAESGDEVVVISYASFQVADAYTKAEADAEFVSVSGDTITGDLVVGGATPFSSALSVKTDGVKDALVLYHPSITTGAKILFADNIYSAAIRSTPDGVSNKTGLAFDVHQSEKMRIDSAGRVTTPSQPAFYGAYTGVNVAWANNQTFGWNIVHMNVGNHFNGATGLFTAPVTGVYSFNYNAWASSGPTQVCFKINGTDWKPAGADTQGIVNLANADGSRTGGVTLVIPLAAGDYAHVGMRTGFADIIYMGHSHFSGYLIG